MAEDRLRARRYGAFALALSSVILIVAALHLSASDDPRLPSLTPFLLLSGNAGLALFRTLLRKPPPRDAVIFVCVMSVFFALISPISSAFAMHPLENHVLVSPDGRYTARLVYWDGMTYGYDFVCVKSNAPMETWAGAEEIAEADAEGIENIEWSGPHVLTVQYAAGSGFAFRGYKWRDVFIEYEAQAAPKP